MSTRSHKLLLMFTWIKLKITSIQEGSMPRGSRVGTSRSVNVLVSFPPQYTSLRYLYVININTLYLGKAIFVNYRSLF